MRWIIVSLFMLLPTTVDAQISPNQYYGSGIRMESVGNKRISLPVSGIEKISYRFRAAQSASITTLRTYLMNRLSAGPGYALGTGGTLRLELQEDDGLYRHLPSGTVLAEVEYPDVGHPDNTDAFHEFSLSSPALTAGRIYHLVWSNTDPDPASNYISLNMVHYDPGQIPAQPTIRPEDFAAFAFNGTSWYELAPPEIPPPDDGAYIPILDIVYSNGAKQGQSYYQNAARHVIGGSSGTSAAQEVIDVTGPDRRVVRISAPARLVSGTGSLRIQVRDAVGSTINDCLVPSSEFVPNEDTYVTCAFTAAYTLLSGERYFVTLQASAGTTYDTLGLTNHAETNPKFGVETSFPDGQAQYKVNGGPWIQWDDAQGNPAPWFDLQFYFTLE